METIIIVSVVFVSALYVGSIFFGTFRKTVEGCGCSSTDCPFAEKECEKCTTGGDLLDISPKDSDFTE